MPFVTVIKTKDENSTNDPKQGRAMDISLTDMNSMINSIHMKNTTEEKLNSKNYVNTDLSDVSMDNDDMDLEFSGNAAEKDNASSLNVYGETRVVNKPHIEAMDKSFMPLLIPSISSAKDVIEAGCIDAGKLYKVSFVRTNVYIRVKITCMCKFHQNYSPISGR